VLDVDQYEVEPGERRELDDAADGPGQEAAEERIVRANALAERTGTNCCGSAPG